MDRIAELQHDFPALFRGYVANSMASLLAAVRIDKAQDFEHTRYRMGQVIDFALKMPGIWPQTRELLLSLSPKMEQAGYWREWIPVLSRAIPLSEELGDRRAHAELCLQVGIMQRLLANYDHARNWLQLAEDAFDSMNDCRNLARAMYRHAQAEQIAGEPDTAIKLAKRALTLFGESDPERGGCYSVMGAVAHDQGNREQAEQYFRLALDARRAGSNTLALAWAYADLGAALRGQKRYEEAIASYKLAFARLDATQAPAQQAVIRLNMSAVYLSMNNPQPALDLCAQIEPVFRRIGDVRRLIMVETNIGMAYRFLRQWGLAEQAITEAVALARKHSIYRLLANALNELGLVYLEAGRASDAMSVFADATLQVAQIDNEAVQEYYRRVFASQRRTAEIAMSESSTPNAPGE